MELPKDISDYLRKFAPELGDRILQRFPPLQSVEDPSSPLLEQLLRKPFPAQKLAIMGTVKQWNEDRAGAVIAECGTGKTLISLGVAHVHSEGNQFAALAMVPPQLVGKWAREAFRTLPRVRVFLVDGLRTQTTSACQAGVNEVRLRNGKIIREGLHTSLTDLRLRKGYRTARERWDSLCNAPALFIVGRDRGKLSYFWRHAFTIAKSGRYQGSVTNPDSGAPVYSSDQTEAK